MNRTRRTDAFLVDEAAVAAAEPAHIGRSWAGHQAEDLCPCPQAPCGLVLTSAIDPTCPQHDFRAGRSIRQSHPAAVCPAAVAAAPEPQPSTAGVGMPATLHLHAFGREINDSFGYMPYLVGSAARGKEWRDVDVRLILPDKEFDALFPGHLKPDHADARWSLLCAAISELGRMRTGLPIDFQIQRTTEANVAYGGPRHALGLNLAWPA
ncbi:hypothetical protein ABZ883_04720 [Streptomyces sp. NPDC046977]|uniref:hypothetical protein n=1 Tax=Streptomyces sp. NPDC046977 TaxID=3154703 RepID=UPI0033DF9526